MAGEADVLWATGNSPSVYITWNDPNGKNYRTDTHVFESALTANWASYYLTCTEQDTTGIYLGDAPASSYLTPGLTYEYRAYLKGSGARGPGDLRIGGGTYQVPLEPFIRGSVNDAAATTSSFIAAAGLSASDGFYEGLFLAFISGANNGIDQPILDYDGATRLFTTSPFPVAPANGDRFIIIGHV